jgi:hypothetical protein
MFCRRPKGQRKRVHAARIGLSEFTLQQRMHRPRSLNPRHAMKRFSHHQDAIMGFTLRSGTRVPRMVVTIIRHHDHGWVKSILDSRLYAVRARWARNCHHRLSKFYPSP